MTKQKLNRGDPQDELYSAVVARDLKKTTRLLENRIVPDNRSLFQAIRQKSHDILKVLVANGADVNALEPYWNCTPVVRALKSQNYEAAKALLDAGASPNKDSAFDRPLIFAAEKGLLEGARLLIAAGADIEQRDKSEMTPLIVAARCGNAEMVKLLLQAGASPLSVDVLDRTAYDSAVEEDHKEVARILAPVSSGKVQRPKPPVEQLLDAIKNNNAAAFDKCLADGVDVNKRDRWGWNPLDRAVDAGSIKFVRKLITAGANVNAHKEGCTALDLAVNNKRPDIAALLVEAGAIPRAFGKNGSDPFWTVCVHGDAYLARLFLDAGADPDSANSSGQTALMNAVGKRGSLELIELLISKGAEIERADANGWTALFHAVQSDAAIRIVHRKFQSGAKVLAAAPARETQEDKRSTQIVELLLTNGANVHRRDNEGRTPLTYATSNSIARLLVRAGAKLNARDKRGRDVNNWLKRNGIDIPSNPTHLRPNFKKAKER
jgi:ankyrin repeat protein